jgi:predicted DNA-binding transcriptional regulator YafY
MSRRPTYRDARNLLTILRWLQETFFGRLRIKEICDRLGVSERTMQRYILVLVEEYGDVFETTKIGGDKYLIFKRFSLENRTGFQLAPLYLSRFFLSFLKGTPLDESLNEAVESFEQGLERSERRHLGALGKKFWVVSVGPKLYERQEMIIDRLLRSLLHQRRVEINYRRPGEEEASRYLFEPYTMLIYKQGLYLIGSTERHSHVFYLAVERIESCKLSEQYFDYPVDFTPQAFCEGCFGIFKDEMAEVEIEFSSKVAEYVRARLWHPTQKITDLDGGGLRLAMTVNGTQEVIPWVLSFGEHAEVLAPEAMRRQLAGVIRCLADYYDR